MASKKTNYFAWRLFLCDSGFFHGELTIWTNGHDPTSCGSRSYVRIRFQANKLTFDQESGRWRHWQSWDRQWESAECSRLLYHNSHDDSQDRYQPSSFCAPYWEDLDAGYPEAAQEAVKVIKRIHKAIERYNLQYRFPGDVACQYVAALQSLGDQHVYYRNGAWLTGSGPLYM